MERTPRDKQEALNKLLVEGYNICFILDHVVQDYMTNAEMVDFYVHVRKNYPDPHDTTHRYEELAKKALADEFTEEVKPCRILRLISKQP
jgi:hypothetical protein